MTVQANVFLPDEIFLELKRRAPLVESQSNLIAEALSYFFSTHKTTGNNDLECINS